jgi:hypothetical protein
MKRLSGLLGLPVLLACALLPACAVPAQAQLFFKKKTGVPAQRVPELILVLKTEMDERKRAAAAEELRDYDPKTFTEIIPVLVDALRNDKKVSVRVEALSSLSRLRPVNQLAGQAIERAASDDEALRIRLQAKSALLKYHLAGYKSEPVTVAPSAPAAVTGPIPARVDPPVVPAVTFPPAPGEKTVPPPPDVPRPLPKGLAVPPGRTPPPVIQIEGPALTPRSS